MKKITYLCLFASVFLLCSCATMMRGDGEIVQVNSNIDNLNIKVVNKFGTTVFESETPTSIYIPNKNYHTVYATKKGYSDVKIEIGKTTSRWQWGNIIFLFPGFLIADIVDISSGRHYRPDEENINVYMTPILYN